MVTVYTKPNCPQCIFTFRKLDELGIEYEVKDVTEDGEALATIKGLGYLAAPVVMAMGDHWSGFQPDRIVALAESMVEKVPA